MATDSLTAPALTHMPGGSARVTVNCSVRTTRLLGGRVHAASGAGPPGGGGGLGARTRRCLPTTGARSPPAPEEKACFGAGGAMGDWPLRPLGPLGRGGSARPVVHTRFRDRAPRPCAPLIPEQAAGTSERGAALTSCAIPVCFPHALFLKKISLPEVSVFAACSDAIRWTRAWGPV